MMRVLLAAMLLTVVAAASALTPQEEGVLTPEQDARYRTFIHELRCLVCQNQTIADSNADLAADLRRQVHELIVQGKTDDEIREYVTERFGDFVLYKPPMSARTVVLWVGPFLLVLGGVFVVLRILRRQPRAAPVAAPDDAARLRRLLDEER